MPELVSGKGKATQILGNRKCRKCMFVGVPLFRLCFVSGLERKWEVSIYYEWKLSRL